MTRAHRLLFSAARHRAAAAARAIFYAFIAICAGIYGALIAFAAFQHYAEAGAAFGTITGFFAAALLIFGGAKRIDKLNRRIRNELALASSLISRSAVLRVRTIASALLLVLIVLRHYAQASSAAAKAVSSSIRALHARARMHARISVLPRARTRALSSAWAS